MADEYTPTMDELIESYAYSDDGSDFKSAMRARRAAAYELLAAHDAEIRRDQAEKDAVLAESDTYDGLPLSSDEVSYNVARREAGNDIRAQFPTPSPETEQENAP